MTTNNSGQATIESMAMITLVIGLVAAVLMVAYLGFLRVYLSHLLHESLICRAEGHSAAHCEQQLRNRLKPIMVFGNIQPPRWRANLESGEGELLWQWQEFKIVVKSRYVLSTAWR